MSIRSLSTSTLTQQKRYPAMSATEQLASGGNVEGPANGYYYHIFTESGDLNAIRNGTCEVLLIAGGGGGGGTGGSSAGGGGAGGLILTAVNLTPGSYSIVIGDGGANGGLASTTNGSNGGDSTFAGLTAKGGGGGSAQNGTAQTGGSGGGGGDNNGSAAGADPLGLLTTSVALSDGIGEQGHAGSSSNGGNNAGGGGGGAGSPGRDAGASGDWKIDNEHAGSDTYYGLRSQGGMGKRLDDWGADVDALTTGIFESRTWTGISGSDYTGYWIASGGSGGNDGSSGPVTGALGGGATSAGQGASVPALDALANSGGGGGGGADNNTGSDGATGVCIVRYRL